MMDGKAAGTKANQEAPKGEPRVKRIAGVLEVPSCSDLGEGHVGIGDLNHDDVRTAGRAGNCSKHLFVCQFMIFQYQKCKNL
jgi:hypothetical protein